MPLSGKTALVTGASAGIGRASAVALAQAGAKVIATGRRKPELEPWPRNAVEALSQSPATSTTRASWTNSPARP